jgi:hypothetical protein
MQNEGCVMGNSIKTIQTTCVLLSLCAVNQAHASIINSINGNGYEWLELSSTMSLSRDKVESLLSDANSDIYGYRYATRAETQSLLESYMPYLPAELNQWETYLVPGAQAFFSDFGITYQETLGTTLQAVTSNGDLISYNMYLTSYFNYGAASECGTDYSCMGNVFTAAFDGNILAQFTPSHRGFDALWSTPDLTSVYSSDPAQASLLVRDISPVPIPSAFWLFGTGIFTLIGFARAKKS